MSCEGTEELRCHPAAPAAAVRRIVARVRRAGSGTLELSFRVEGELGRLWIPLPAPPRSADRLWQHTCFEAFIALEGEDGYHELNFSPSGEWAVYTFKSYRERRSTEGEPPTPLVTARSADDHLDLDAMIDLGTLSPRLSTAALRIGLSAVVEDIEGKLSYWALRHPRETPDFHDARGFGLRLEPPLAEC